MIHEPGENQIYVYNPANGLFEVQLVPTLRGLFDDRMRELASQAGGDYKHVPQLITMQNLNGVIEALKGFTLQADAFARAPDLPEFCVHAANTMLVLPYPGAPKWEQEGFSPAFRSRNQSPIPYDTKALCQDFETGILGHHKSDDRLLIQKIAGQCVLGRNIASKILILHGLSGSSKSTLVLIIQGLTGYANCYQLRTHLLLPPIRDIALRR